MKIEEVLQQLSDIKDFEPNLVEGALQDEECMEKDIEALDIAIEVIKRQMPKRPLAIREKHDFQGNVILKDGYCPKCKKELSNAYQYCNNCGQKLDWN